MNQTFSGTLYLCNANPGQSAYLPSIVTINDVSPSGITLNLKTDSSFIDTTLLYSIECEVVEKDIPIIYVKDTNGNEVGQYNQSPDRITFSFAYNTCTENTFFEGTAL